jgi:hypothetical protein
VFKNKQQKNSRSKDKSKRIIKKAHNFNFLLIKIEKAIKRIIKFAE